MSGGLRARLRRTLHNVCLLGRRGGHPQLNITHIQSVPRLSSLHTSQRRRRQAAATVATPPTTAAATSAPSLWICPFTWL